MPKNKRLKVEVISSVGPIFFLIDFKFFARFFNQKCLFFKSSFYHRLDQIYCWNILNRRTARKFKFIKILVPQLIWPLRSVSDATFEGEILQQKCITREKTRSTEFFTKSCKTSRLICSFYLHKCIYVLQPNAMQLFMFFRDSIKLDY